MASAASACLLQKSVVPKFSCSPTVSASATHLTNASFFNTVTLSDQPSHAQRPCFRLYAKKRNEWLDPFDFGDDPDMEYGSIFSDGKQDEDPRPPDNPDNPYGFLKFPMGYSVEIASLALKIRGVEVDVIASPRGKQTYELNKNVRWADAYDPDIDFPDPAEYTDMIGILKNRYYDMILSTKLAGIGHASFLFMSTARDRVSYVYPNVNSAGAGLFLSQTFTPDSLNLSDGGYHMYHQMTDWLGRPARGVPREPLPPLKVSISRKLKDYVMEKYTKAGAEKGKYIVIHGIQSDSKASMQSNGDTDSLLPIQTWAEIASTIRGLRPVFVIPHEKVREDVEEIIGEEASIVFISTPGQLAALINDSVGVIATNTAAVQLSVAREKPCIALFSSQEKGKLFVPDAEVKKCKIISSKTGALADIDIETIKAAVQIFEMPLALV
ncbi:Photosynthetic NDH subunit of subcomplex B 1 chloroplastic [Heracleum sosnowskyi]|uniref:Photosynthetic NDH subunit of subcomplex B 1 chloroplastic n=1 Tax=Heracleum sosnowskyi TaxID=360622 RepID=A0AAD8J9H1_9APIA|nr:Photosynthetic NDH subunit of subcomplex B 1 chloroplastic [Heracleum sosnowskyi]